MVTRKPRIVIIGGGMAGVTAANKLHKCAASRDLFELFVVEGGERLGGRINSSVFGGDRIEKGATWIHGIGGSPVHQIAKEINSLVSEQPWECMDEPEPEPELAIVAEGGYSLKPSLVEPISNLFNKLMEFAQGKLSEDGLWSKDLDFSKFLPNSFDARGALTLMSMGSFLRVGLDAYWNSREGRREVKLFGNWELKQLESAIFAMLESTQRTYTSAGDLNKLDFSAETEYQMFPGEEITIAKGYSSVIESLASMLPRGTVQLDRKVVKLEWQPDGYSAEIEHPMTRPVKLHFCDGSTMSADHVIVTVSLGVLKQGTREDPGMFSPPLPSFKTKAISRLGYGVVNKLFLQLSQDNNFQQGGHLGKSFPSLKMVFHRADSKLKHPEIPWWMRRTTCLSPIYTNSSVVLSWFVGEEALEIESLSDEEIISGVSATVSNFLQIPKAKGVKFSSVLKTQWGTDPLFRGSYSYIALGSSGEDFDAMAEPLPRLGTDSSGGPPPLQILFAGEATHRTHYSTTHGAYLSGLREANRLLQHYKCGGSNGNGNGII